jgi:hypothetical protein
MKGLASTNKKHLSYKVLCHQKERCLIAAGKQRQIKLNTWQKHQQSTRILPMPPAAGRGGQAGGYRLSRNKRQRGLAAATKIVGKDITNPILQVGGWHQLQISGHYQLHPAPHSHLKGRKTGSNDNPGNNSLASAGTVFGGGPM